MTCVIRRGGCTAALLAGQVDLRGPAAAGAAEFVIGGFVARWLDLFVRTASGSGGVLVG